MQDKNAGFHRPKLVFIMFYMKIPIKVYFMLTQDGFVFLKHGLTRFFKTYLLALQYKEHMKSALGSMSNSLNHRVSRNTVSRIY